MAQGKNGLTAAFVKTVKHSGKTRSAERRYDSGRTGLALNVKPPNSSKSWIQVLVVHGRRVGMGLGSYPRVSLADARKKALANQDIARSGGDPRRPKKGPPLFRDAAATVIQMQESSWTNPKSKRQWQSSLDSYVFPSLGDVPVDRITPADILDVLTPIWTSKPETARRVRQRISAVMRWAIACGHRIDNPAQDAIRQVLPRRRTPVKHFKSLPYAQVGEAIARVRASAAFPTTKLSFELLVLTAARSGEARGATWGEIDMASALWVIDGSRMKGNAEHRVPLAPRCLEILRQARSIAGPSLIADSDLVFPSARGKLISSMTHSKLMRQLGIDGLPHGFRSSFRDWAAENTDAPHAVQEAALAHKIPSAVERAYARSDLLARRRKLMEQWAAYLARKNPQVDARDF